MNPATRRQFLQSALAAGTALTLSRSRAAAIEPFRRPAPARMRLSLAAYSYNRYLDLRRGRKPTMTLEQFIDAAGGMPLAAVELTAYYFRETTPRYLAGLKGRCTRLGLDISGTAVGNNFTTSNTARLKEQLGQVRSWIEHTSRLGGKTMRIFAGGVDKGDTEERARARCVAAIQEACEHAAQFGIYLALENHGGIVGTIDQMLTLVRAVKSDWFGVNLDTGNFHSRDPYADLARLAPYAITVQLKTEIQRQGKKPEEADLKRLLEMLRGVNYRGYVALEYEARADPKEAVPRYVGELHKLLG
jgi:sugar phosphate isomerase/epimerase